MNNYPFLKYKEPKKEETDMKKKEPIQELLQKDGQWDVEKFISRKITHAMEDEDNELNDMGKAKKEWLEAMLKQIQAQKK